MISKIESFLTRYAELEQLLADPEVIQDRVRYQKLAKEMARLSKLVDKYKKFERLTAELASLEELSAAKEDPQMAELAAEELEGLTEQVAEVKRELEDMLLDDDEDADRNILVEIRAGTGGQEASLFAAELYRMYVRFGQEKGLKSEVMSLHESEAGGYKEIIFSLEGPGAYKLFNFESGVHRVQRVPVTEASGRIHTSAVTVAVLPEAEEVDISIAPQDLTVDVYRSSGCGGQSVNTTDSAVRITHLPTGIVVTCQDERSQLKNKIKAMRVLRARLLDQIRHSQQDKIAQHRKSQVGSGDRSEKIRTYNFPDRRVTDHRIGLTLYKLEAILQGDLEEIITGLHDADRKAKLQAALDHVHPAADTGIQQ